MPTSGIVAGTLVDAAMIIDTAVSRCKISPSDLSAEDISKARNALYLLLLNFSNRGINLWCIEQAFVPNVVGQAGYPLGLGTVDVASANFRQIFRLTNAWTSSAGGNPTFLIDGDLETRCIQTTPNGVLTTSFASPTSVRMLGMCAGSSFTQTVSVQVSGDGISWRQTQTLPPTMLDSHGWAWYELDPAIPERFFRIAETGGAILDYRELVIAQDLTDVPMSRYNSDDYQHLPNKLVTGRPLQYWFDRQRDPKIYLWPTPNSPFNCIQIKRHRQIQDVGDLTNEVDIPNRWIEATIARLAKKLVLELSQADITRYDILRQEDEEAFFAASSEERDNSPVYLAPDISGYT